MTCLAAKKHTIIFVRLKLITHGDKMTIEKGVTMKRFAKPMLGVTLLEILLVLAIAAMIIVMSVRYYQSASQSSQANSFIQQVQNITAAVESLAVSGGYGSGNITNTKVEAIVGASGLVAPWGATAMQVTGTANGYQLKFPAAGDAQCTLIKARLEQSKNYKVAEDCTSLEYSATGVFPSSN